MKRQLNLTPEPHIISSLTHTDISWPEALSEIVDNSLDQAATKVHITFSPDTVSVADNGNGCANIESMLRLGSHRKTDTTRLGRFGVGLKNAAVGKARVLQIETRHNGIKRKATVDWDELKASGGWSSIVSDETKTNEASGTVVDLIYIHNEPLVQKVNNALAFTFAPALWNEASIVVWKNGESIAVEPWHIPKMTHTVEATETRKDNGTTCGFKVKAGIVDSNDRDPFILSYGHRIIGGTSEPMMDMRTSSRFMAFVELTGEWPLLKHKDGLRDSPAAEWLYEALFQSCRELIEMVQREGETLEIKEIEANLEIALGFKRGKARRTNGGELSGGVEPKDTKRKVREASLVDGDGDTDEKKSKRSRTGITLTYDRLSGDSVGKVDMNAKRICIVLNELHPFVSECLKARDKESLQMTCLSILAAHQAFPNDSAQVLFTFENEGGFPRYIEAYSKFLRNCKSHNAGEQ
jgi:hypothetical protein